MGAWSEGIYGNDTALDLVNQISQLIDDGNKPIDIIVELLDNKYDTEELLVLADFELFVIGKVFFTSDVIKTIDDLIRDTSTWNNPKEREKVLINFKQKILDNRNADNIQRDITEIKKWLSEK